MMLVLCFGAPGPMVLLDLCFRMMAVFPTHAGLFPDSCLSFLPTHAAFGRLMRPSHAATVLSQDRGAWASKSYAWLGMPSLVPSPVNPAQTTSYDLLHGAWVNFMNVLCGRTYKKLATCCEYQAP